MSQVIWSEVNVPSVDAPVEAYKSEFYDFTIERSQKIPQNDAEIEIPDPRSFRLMSRASILLSSICMRGRSHLNSYLSNDPYSVGIYCAIENGPIDLPSTQKMLEISFEEFGHYYKKFRSPKMYLKQLPNLAPAQMGIFLGIRGPMNVYTHSLHGSLQALEQAEQDLHQGVVKAALVCSAFSFESPLITYRASRQRSGLLAEGASALILTASHAVTDWKNLAHKNSEAQENYGISHDLIHLIKRGIQ